MAEVFSRPRDRGRLVLQRSATVVRRPCTAGTASSTLSIHISPEAAPNGLGRQDMPVEHTMVGAARLCVIRHWWSSPRRHGSDVDYLVERSADVEAFEPEHGAGAQGLQSWCSDGPRTRSATTAHLHAESARARRRLRSLYLHSGPRHGPAQRCLIERGIGCGRASTRRRSTTASQGLRDPCRADDQRHPGHWRTWPTCPSCPHTGSTIVARADEQIEARLGGPLRIVAHLPE